MVEQWLREPGPHRPPTIPESSDIAATLDAVEQDPVSRPDVPTISAALISEDEAKAYGAIECLHRLQDHHPSLLEDLDDEFLQAFQQSENPFVTGRLAELLERQAEIDGETDDLVSEFGQLLDPQFSVRIRAPILRMIAAGIGDNWLQFGRIESYVRDSLTSSYPSVQAPALEILATVVEKSGTYEPTDYVDEVLAAVHVDDAAVQEQAMRVLTSIVFQQPAVGRQVSDRIVALLESDTPAVRRWAFQCLYGMRSESQDVLAAAAPNFVSLLVGDDKPVQERLEAAFPDSSIRSFAARPVTNAIFWDEALLDRIETDRIVESFDADLIGTVAGIEVMILLAEIAAREPETVAPVAPALESALTTGRDRRERPLEDTALLFGRLADAEPERVDSVIQSHLDALGEPGIDDELIVWELGHIAHGAPEHVADAIGVTGVSEWPEDPFEDSVGTRLCRGMLATVAPGYATSDERSAALVETAVATYLDDEAEGYFGEVLHRIARTEPTLVEPHTPELRELLGGDFIRMRLLAARILDTVGAEETLRRHETACRLTARRVDEALGRTE